MLVLQFIVGCLLLWLVWKGVVWLAGKWFP
jgi:hypothetical protein